MFFFTFPHFCLNTFYQTNVDHDLGNVSPKPSSRLPRPDFCSTLLPLPDRHVLLSASAYTRETGRQTRGHFHEARGFLRRCDVPSPPGADLPGCKPSPRPAVRTQCPHP